MLLLSALICIPTPNCRSELHIQITPAEAILDRFFGPSLAILLCLKALKLFQLFPDLLIFLIEQIVPSLDIFGQFITFDNRNFKINSPKLHDVIYFQIVDLIFSLEPFQNIVAAFFISENDPHGSC